jgi:hypothetical protein
VLRQRNIDNVISNVERNRDNAYAAAATAAAKRGLRACALAGCAAREVHASQFKKCAACQGAAYCCKEHQTTDWPSHKAACKAARKAAAAQDEV